MNVRLDGPGVAARASNTITSGALALVRDYLLAGLAEEAPMGPVYIALGDGGMPAGGGHYWTRVSGERLRFPIVQRTVGGSSVTYKAFIPSGHGLGLVVNVMGLWAGQASTALGTGTLMAHAALPASVQLLQAYQLAWTLTVSGSVG